MENIHHFSPLWERLELIFKPEQAIEELRIKSLQAFLHNHRSEAAKPLNLNQVVLECTCIIQQLLENNNDENEILQRLHNSGQGDPLAIVKKALVLWYAGSCPIFSRDPHQGLPPDSELEDDSGAPILTWSRRFFHEQHAIGNLGLMAMLMTSETWLSPKHEKLKAASLISTASATILFASYLICTEAMHRPWAHDVSSAQSSEAMALFIRSSWQVARENSEIFDSPPGREFGATLKEVKLSDDGKRFLTKIGHESWHEAPYWHPCRRVPGSSWNKYLRNFACPLFPTHLTTNYIHISLPTTMFSLVQPWEAYYAELRIRFDQVRHFQGNLLMVS
uniref:Mating type A-1-2 protein n=1 Tax=Epichloe glyceriae TaxID=79591 RepID=A0A513WY57_9HYPO|nr:mating type A-1-2 protein [Epichloe glyceriae]